MINKGFYINFLYSPKPQKILNNSNKYDIKRNQILSWMEFFTIKDLENVKEKLKEVYNARDAFLYVQSLMLKREREEGIKEGMEKVISENTSLNIEEIEKL